MFRPVPIVSADDRHSRTDSLGTTHARTYDPELDPVADYNHRLVDYATFVLGR